LTEEGVLIKLMIVAVLAGGGLARSTVSSTTVQPQPAPGTCHYRGHGLDTLPDPRCTPGAIDPAVTESDIHRTICVSGYTESIRPPESITEAEKRLSMKAYDAAKPLHAYEYDHLVALELGGARNDPRNLWPDPGPIPNRKDELAGRLRKLVCAGRLKLATAQLLIARNWVQAYGQYG
jgi:hypothetical protein